MLTFIFNFNPRKGQLYVKLGQIWSNFKFQIFFTKICLCCTVLSHDTKNAIYFYVLQLMPKTAFPKFDVIKFTAFWGHCTTKNKYIALKFRMRVVCMCLDHILSGFWDKLKILDFIGSYFWKI